MYDIILFGDSPNIETYSRATGAHRIATEVRSHGYSALVVDFSNYLSLEMFKQIVDGAVGKNTLAVGFSTTWFPYRLPDGRFSVNEPSKPKERFDPTATNSDNTLTVDFGQYEKISEYLSFIKQKNKKTKIILGGAKAYMYASAPYVDNVFIGYSETMIIEYLNSLSGKGIKRIWNKIIDHDSKAQNPSWNFCTSKIAHEPESFILPSETLSLEIGRGCRFKCKFCSFPLIGQKNITDYVKQEECLYNELIDNYNKFGVWKYIIVDDTLNDTTEKLEMVKRVVNRLPFQPAFWAYMRLDLIASDFRQIQLAKDIGIREVYFGIETLNREAGKAIGKGLPPEKITEALERCHREWGDHTWITTGLICGLPNDNVADFEKSCSYFDRSDRPAGHINTTPLRIIEYTDFTKYRFNSEFEINADKYGYKFPNKEIPWYWTKEDGSDIINYDQASKLAVSWQAKLNSHIKLQKSFFSLSCINNNKYDYNKLMCLSTQQEFDDYVNEDTRKLMYDQINDQYFAPLLAFLSNNKEQLV